MAGEQRAVAARLRAVVEAKDAELAVLRAELDAAREREGRLRMDSSASPLAASQQR